MTDTFDISRIKEFGYYAPRLLKIKTNIPDESGLSTERIIPFTFNATQQKLHLLWEKLLSEIGYVRIIVLKARRQGISTYIEGRGFHRVHTTSNTHGFIIAHDKDGTNTIFDMSKLFYEALPKQFKPMKRYSSKKELVFENPDERTRFTNPGLRSKIEVFTANKVTSARSGGYSCGHFSEVAFFPDAESLISATSPTIPKIPGSFVVYESTACGKGGFFHDEWLRATEKTKHKQTNFIPIFFSWLEFPSYSLPFDGKCIDRCTEKDYMHNLDPEEKMLHRKHKATPQQLHWRHHTILDLSSDVDLFHQEYPTTADEAFISSGQCYFNRRKVQDIIDRSVDPIWVGDVDMGGLTENEDGCLQIWTQPEKNCEYMIGCDVGGGTDEGDPSTLEVFKVPKGIPLLEQVAEWSGNLDPVIFASKAIGVAEYYNNAMLAPEINNHGLTTLNEIKAHYWNIYRWQYFDRFGKTITDKLGWQTNVATRPLLCDYCSACVNADILKIKSRALAEEMMSFIKRPTTGGEAEEGCHDDLVMAMMISIFCLAHSFQTSSILTEMGIMVSPIVTESKPKLIVEPAMTDMMSFLLPTSKEMEVTGGDRGWMEY